MPSALKYLPPTDAARNMYSEALAKERDARNTAYNTALQYYLGNQPEALEVAEGEVNDNLIINMVRLTADRTASFLFPEVPKIQLARKSITPTEQENWVRRVIEESGGVGLLYLWVIRGFLAGHSFLRVKPGDPYPKIDVLDPRLVNVFWRADDVSDVMWYEIQYDVGDVRTIKDFVREGKYWKIYTYQSIGEKNQVDKLYQTRSHRGLAYSIQHLDFGAGNYELTGVETWTSSVPPVIDTPHLPPLDNYYGTSEASFEEIQNAINRTASSIFRIVRENADPIDVVTGSDAADIIDEGGIISISNPAASVTRLEMRTDLSSVQNTLDFLIEHYLSLVRVIIVRDGAAAFQRVTDAGVRTVFIDMISKNRVLQSSYGSTLRKVIQLCLEIGVAEAKIPGGGIEDVGVKWAETLPVNLSDKVSVIAAALDGGYISKRSAHEMADLTFTTWEEEEAQIEKETQAALELARRRLEIESMGQDQNQDNGDGAPVNNKQNRSDNGGRDANK
jgi:hypothetical protein